MKNNLLPIALSYLSKGYSVFPVGMDKRPLILWKEFQTRRATPEELVGWWTQNPDAQIGIATGALSNLTVIDLEFNADFDLIKDETYAVKTGGGGKHLYFFYDPDFKNMVKVLPNIDCRSEGGYVIGAESETSKGVYKALNNLDVAQMSIQTKTLLLGATRRRLDPSTPEVTSYPRTPTEGLDYEGCNQGGRNDAMTKFAGTVHAKLHPSLWSSIGLKLFEEANKKNTPPLNQGELRVIWNSISTREITQNPEGRIYNAKPKTWGPDNRELIETFPVENEDGEIVDTKETLHISEVAELQKIDSDHTYPIDMPPFDEALLGGFSAADLIVVAGQSGHGKTTLIQDWTATLASGGQAAGRVKLPTLWFSYEVLAKPLWQKFQGMGVTAETPLYMPKFNETGETEWVIDVVEQAIKKWGIKVVAIDHLGFLRAPKGNYSNAADGITHTVRALKRLAVKHGLIILLPVHVRKTTSKVPDLNDIKDSLGIAQEADTVFFIGREKDDAGLPTAHAKVWLVKNRKTGASVSAMFDFQFGRYYYNANIKKEDGVEQFSQGSVQPLEDY